MTFTLFDSITRTDESPADYSDTNYEYVNRTNRAHFQTIRHLLESWFTEFVKHNPESAKDLHSRFRSKRNEEHLAALTELYLHHLLLANGFIPQAHPNLPSVSTKPEFFALKDKKPHFVVEAVLVYDNKVMSRTNKFEANILDAINAVNSPDFLISVDIEARDPDTQPKQTSVTQFLQRNIDTLSYDQVCREYEASQNLPKWTYTQNAWKLEFTASPVTEDGRKRRTAESRVVGATVHGASIINVDEAIRDNVREKAKKYGKFDIPFIIVVNVIRESIFCDDDTIMEALFGKEVLDVIRYEDGSYKQNPRRDFNGIWAAPKIGITNFHVSGVIFMSGLGCGTVETVKPVLWHHPQATHPLDMSELDVEQRYFEKGSGRLKNYNSEERDTSN